jgi:tyrosine-protein phosphatase YwqE
MGFLSNIFKKKEKAFVDLENFSALKTDIHSHLIPGIDDGAKSLDESINLILGLQSLGYKKLITTPHVMADFYKNDKEIILSGLKRLKEALVLHKIDMKIDAAAEYYLDEHFMSLIAAKDLLTFGKNMVLFELSFFEEPKQLDQVIFDLQLEGYTAVLAHPERYPYWHKSMDKMERLHDKGVLFQVNLGSLSGNYGPDVMKMAEKMAANNWVSLLGSDTHHMLHIQLFSSLKTNPTMIRLLNDNSLLNSKL